MRASHSFCVVLYFFRSNHVCIRLLRGCVYSLHTNLSPFLSATIYIYIYTHVTHSTSHMKTYDTNTKIECVAHYHIFLNTYLNKNILDTCMQTCSLICVWQFSPCAFKFRHFLTVLLMCAQVITLKSCVYACASVNVCACIYTYTCT
jgi:hypothetical protein